MNNDLQGIPVSHPPNLPVFNSVEVGRTFLSFYQSLGYEELPGSSLLDPSIPMSFVMSAGLVQVERSTALRGGRNGRCYTLLQNCFRHFDLDKIGDSDIHLSYFQMPGAFTFGKPNRWASIEKIWELLIDVYGFCSESVWVTYFSGGEVAEHTFEPDRETYQAWLQAGVPKEQLIGLGPDECFWKQGSSVVGKDDAPKCGPNTEVFIDRGAHFRCSSDCRPGCRCGRFVEIVNMLFIVWHIDEETGVVRELDDPFVEAVAGIERIAMLLLGKSSVFEIDSIYPLIKHIRQFAQQPDLASISGIRYERILADFLRASLFLTADGAPKPGSGGRAYLMRRLVRGIVTSQEIFRIIADDFMQSLVDIAINLYAEQHSKLIESRDQFLKNYVSEKAKFKRTLKKGERILDHKLDCQNGFIDAKDIVKIEKCHGVPKSLLQVMLSERRIPFDHQEYRAAYTAWYKSVTS